MELSVSPPKWTTALPDWERRIIAGESIVPVKPIYPVMANRAVAFMERLRLRDVLGQPTIGEVTRDWVYDFAGAVFGAQNPTTYRRDINDFFLLILLFAALAQGAAMLYKSDRSNIISGWLLILGGNIWFLISVAFLAPYPPLNTGMILPPLMSFVCVLAGKNLMDYSMLRKS